MYSKWDIRDNIVKTICGSLDYTSMLGEDKHTNCIMGNINKLRHRGLFCDVMLQVAIIKNVKVG